MGNVDSDEKQWGRWLPYNYRNGVDDGSLEAKGDDKWRRRRSDGIQGTALLRCFCFHWAGASASAFKPWMRGGRHDVCGEEDNDVELCAVQLPGRENRASELLFDFDSLDLGEKGGKDSCRLRVLAKEFVEDCQELFFSNCADSRSLPCVLFGHAEGSWFAYEVAAYLETCRTCNPSREPCRVCSLIVSNYPAPCTPISERPWSDNIGVDSKRLKEEFASRGAPARLIEDNYLWKELESAIREDTALVRQYSIEQTYESDEVLSCPIRIFLSRACSLVGPSSGRLHLVEDWTKLTTRASTDLDVFYGDHYYVNDSGAGMLSI